MNEHITKEKFDELKTLVKPLHDWMMDNFNMMCRIEIDCDGVTIFAPQTGQLTKAKGL